MSKNIAVKLAATALCLSMMGIPGSAPAYAGTVDAILKTGGIQISLEQKMLDESGNRVDPYEVSLHPTEEVSYIVSVKNDLSPAYIRLKLNYTGEFEGVDDSMLRGISEKWMKQGDYWYYTEPVKTGSLTDFCTSLVMPEFPESTGVPVSVSVDADAVQSANFTPDFTSTSPWGDIEIQSHASFGDSVRSDSGDTGFHITFEDIEDGELNESNDLFKNFRSLMPGDTVSEKITIKNEYNRPISIRLSSDNNDKDTSLNNWINVELKRLGTEGTDEKVVYSGPLYGDDLEKDINLGITQKAVENIAERYSEMEKAASFDTSKVSVNRLTHSFEQKTVYTTFDKEKDPKEILDVPVLINDIPFIVSNTETPTLISQETVEPLVKTIVTDTFLGEETDESNQPFPSISEEGVKYNLTSKTLIEGAVKDRKEHKSTEVTYTSVEDKVKVPEKTVIEMSDKASGKEFEATLDLAKEEVLKEYWDNDFEFSITVSGYGDANVFNLNGIEIPADAELIKYKDEFLKMLDLSTKAYEIESIKWDGEAYMVNGNTMRNAVAKGRKYVKDIKAIYEADVPLPAMPEKSWRCTYTEEFPEGNTLYTMVTNATYTVDPTVAQSRGGLLGVLDSVVGTITAAYSAVIESFTERPIATTIPLVLVAGLISIFVTRRMKEKKILAENTAGNI